MCHCYGDQLDIKAHYTDRNKTCHKCYSSSFITSAVCNCFSQCGCQLGVRCYQCGAVVLPPTGEGYCPRVRAFQIISKDVIKKGRCIRFGCQRLRRYGKDYCCLFCAEKDGAK